MAASKTSALMRNLKTYQIYGASTDVGKTIISTILCKSFAKARAAEKTYYLKPVSTGPGHEADDRHLSRFSPETQTKCLFQFDEAVSPHIAARNKPPLSDSQILQEIQKYLAACSKSGLGTLILETAGGVHSPTPSGSSQADLYRPLRLPVCLVADHHLGGISASISAFESLHVRGYDLDVAMQFEDSKYQNHSYLKEYFEKKGILTLSLPPPPARLPTEDEDFEVLSEYYEKMSAMDGVEEMIFKLTQKHVSRISALEEMSTKAHSQIWYPFTQHTSVSPQSIIAIDSASGDFFQTHSTTATSSLTADQKIEVQEEGVLSPTFDGSASWWTQGLGHGNPDLSLTAAYAAGRYGHVMFAGTIHEPALKLASSLLTHLQNPRLSKVFYSDNGSTGMEVATKMALTATEERYSWEKGSKEVGVLGLKGSYHGDTIGAMDCSEPSAFNERVHWYQGRGYWFDFPQVKCKDGAWVVESPEGMENEFGRIREFNSLGDIFDLQARCETAEGQRYREYIEETIERLVKVEEKRFGALVMEPVILGAGGMLFVDPLFQHTLARTIRSSSHIFGSSIQSVPTDALTWTGLPVIHDEVFTGLYRLGRFSSSSFLQTHPDISVHAKLLTGGLIPLCTTVASESIFSAFLSSEKRDALLHGHSYTAHPVGCHVAETSLKIMQDMEKGGQWQSYKKDWKESSTTFGSGTSDNAGDVWSMWSKDFVTSISKKKDVESVIALGSVLAIALQDENAGYSSNAATGLQKKMFEGSGEFKIHARVLGNVFYLMGSMTSESQTLRTIERMLLDTLV